MKINNRCVGCGQCVAFCKYNAITLFGHALINENCVKCEKCVPYCPLEAIEENFDKPL